MHRPFTVLRGMIKQGSLRLSETDAKPQEPAPPKMLRREPEPSDLELFETAMSDVRPSGWEDIPLRVPGPFEIQPNDDEAEALKVLEEFCRNGHVTVEQSGEYVEHTADPSGRLYLSDLRSGRFAIQAHLDLHGLTEEQAREATEAFLRGSVRKGYGCVRIIHGRGRHSPDRRSVIKESVLGWLRTRRAGRYVVAYTSARLVDGGGGAVYVLLRG
jgi:DNA-nicking Smr family endonuclease